MRFGKNKFKQYREVTDETPNGGNGGGGNGDGTNQTPKPSDTEAELLREVMKRKDSERALKAEVAEREKALKELSEKLKVFDGVDLAEFHKLSEERKAAETKKLEEAGEFERVKQQMVEEHKKTLETLRADFTNQIDQLSGATRNQTKQIEELTVGRLFGDSTFVQESLTLTPAKARVVYGSHFDIVDGAVVGYDKPLGASERTMLVDGEGKALGFNEALRKIVDVDPDREHLLRSTLNPGSGSNSNGGHRVVANDIGSGRNRIAHAMAKGGLKPRK